MEEFNQLFVEMHPMYGRDTHNPPPLYDTDLEEVKAMQNWLRDALASVLVWGAELGTLSQTGSKDWRLGRISYQEDLLALADSISKGE